MTALVVCGNGYIDVLGWRVGIAKRNDGNVDIGSFLNSLGVGSGVGNDDETRLLEGASDVVGEVTRSETTGNSDSPSVSSELEDSSLTVGTGGDDTNIGRVVDGGDDSCCEDDFLPIRVYQLQVL